MKKRKEREQYLQRLREKAPEYVLTISVSEYVNGVGKKLSDYEYRFVTVRVYYDDDAHTYVRCEEIMVEKGEKIDAEKIVDVRPSYYERSLMGTALIPKKNKNKKDSLDSKL